MKYRIEVTEAQLWALISATELLGRVGSGQTFTIQEHMPELTEPVTNEIRKRFQEIRHLTEDEITSDMQCTKQSRISWDLYQVFRHRNAWDRNPKGGFETSFHEPLKRCQEPLAVITAIE